MILPSDYATRRLIDLPFQRKAKCTGPTQKLFPRISSLKRPKTGKMVFAGVCRFFEQGAETTERNDENQG